MSESEMTDDAGRRRVYMMQSRKVEQTERRREAFNRYPIHKRRSTDRQQQQRVYLEDAWDDN